MANIDEITLALVRDGFAAGPPGTVRRELNDIVQTIQVAIRRGDLLDVILWIETWPTSPVQDKEAFGDVFVPIASILLSEVAGDAQAFGRAWADRLYEDEIRPVAERLNSFAECAYAIASGEGRDIGMIPTRPFLERAGLYRKGPTTWSFPDTRRSYVNLSSMILPDD